MNILEEMVSVLLDKDTLQKAKELFKSKNKIIPITGLGMDFRLYFSQAGTISLELCAIDDYGYYFKPIGYYEFINNDISKIYILKEFEEAYIKIKDKVITSSKNKFSFLNIFKRNSSTLNLKDKVSFLCMEENAYIAILSRDIYSLVQDAFRGIVNLPVNMEVNGMNIRVFNSVWRSIEAQLVQLDDNEEEIFVLYTETEVKWGENKLCERLKQKGLLVAISRN